MAIGSAFQIYPFNTKPGAPDVGTFLIYTKTDNSFYIQDSFGVEYAFGSTAAISQLSGEATGVGPGNATVTLSNSAVIGKVLTGFTPGPNSPVLATDTILQAIQKLQAEIASVGGTTLAGDVTGVFSATVVSFVGGKTAAAVAQSVTDTQAATAANTASTIVKRDASGDINVHDLGVRNVNATGTVGGSNLSGTNTGDVTETDTDTIDITRTGQNIKADVRISNATLTSDINGLKVGIVPAAQVSGLAAVATSGNKADVGLGNVDNTSDVNKPVSTAQALADTAVKNYSIQRANHTGTQLASTISDFTEASQDAVGNALVDTNTVDMTYDDVGNAIKADVKISNATLTSDTNGLKVGTVPVSQVSGLAAVATSGNKADVGLGNVDNTSDVNKPVSTAQAAADAAVQAYSIQRANHTGTQTASTISDFTEAAQDAIGAALTDTDTIDMTYDDAGNAIKADVKLFDGSIVSTPTGIKVGVVPAGSITGFDEAAQDAVGGILTDTASVDFTYNDAGNQIKADVLPAGVDHDALQNFIANKHIDHSSVNISAGAGLSGGGDITTTRTISMPNVGTAGTHGSATQVAQVTTDAQGRVSALTDVSIAIPSTQITDFTEAAQDAVGNSLVDTNSIDMTYDDVGNAIKADIKLSADVADSGYAKANTTIHADGLHVEILTDTPVQIGTSNFIGSGTNRIAQFDHIHAHGNQTSGTLHAIVTSLVNGFMSAVDKIKLDSATALNTVSSLVFRDASGNFSATNITANLTGNVSGSSGSFTGSLVGDVTGTQGATVVSTVGGKTASAVAQSVSDTVAATNANTVSTIVKRDSSGNFSAGTITANLTGNTSGSAASFTGSLVGDVTGTQGATVVSTVGGKTASAVATSVNDTIAATSANTISTIVKRDVNGDFSLRDLSNRNLLNSGYVELTQSTQPATPAATKADLFIELQNGFSRLRIIDETGYKSTINRDIIFLVKNTTGSTINKGQAVYVNGSDAVNALPTIALAQANSSTTVPVFGITVESILNGAFGRVISTGLLSGVDTSAFTAGQRVYLSPTVAGGLTSTKPVSPNIWQRIGIVLTSNAATGIIEVRPLATHGEESGTNTAWTSNVVALVDGASIATDASLGNIFTVTLGGNRTLANPTNGVDGQKVTWRIRQDATGSRTLAYGTNFNFPATLAGLSLSTSINVFDYIGAQYNGVTSKWDVLAFTSGLS